MSHCDAAVGDSPRGVEEPLQLVRRTSEVGISLWQRFFARLLPGHRSRRPERSSIRVLHAQGCCYQCYRKVFLSTALQLSVQEAGHDTIHISYNL